MRVILTGFVIAILISLAVTSSSELLKYVQTEFPWVFLFINEIIARINLEQLDVLQVNISNLEYWIIVAFFTLLSIILVKNILKPIAKYFSTISSINLAKNQHESEVARIIIDDLKKTVNDEVLLVYNSVYRKAADDYTERIYECVNQVMNPVIEMAHEFKEKTEKMLAGYSAGAVASLYGKEFFNREFVSDIISMVLKRQLSSQDLNDVIEHQIKINMPHVERKVNEAVSKNVHEMLNNYFEMISIQGRDASEIGGVSLKGFEQQLSTRLNVSLKKISVSVCSIDSESIDFLSNAVIGAGVIGGSMIAGGTGIALIASGPIGLIAGAVIGGVFLFDRKEGISEIIKNIFGGDPTEKLKIHFDLIEKDIISNIEKKIDPVYTNLRKTLNSITEDYLDAVIVELSMKNIVDSGR